MRLEAVDSVGYPWWVPEDFESAAELGQLGPPMSQRCPSCGQEDQQRYIEH